MGRGVVKKIFTYLFEIGHMSKREVRSGVRSRGRRGLPTKQGATQAPGQSKLFLALCGVLEVYME